MKTNTFKKLSEKRQIEILDASAKIFAEKGYFQAGIIEICQTTGISNGALYKYFQNKKGLYLAVAQRTLSLLQSAGIEVTERHDRFWKLLRTTFETVVPFTEKYRDYFIVYLDIGSPSMGEFALELSNDFEGWSVGLFSEAAKIAQSKGEIREDLAIEDVAYLLDNHLLLFAFSRVSEHYNRRFNQFYGEGREEMSDAQKVDRIMTSLRHFLK